MNTSTLNLSQFHSRKSFILLALEQEIGSVPFVLEGKKSTFNFFLLNLVPLCFLRNCNLVFSLLFKCKYHVLCCLGRWKKSRIKPVGCGFLFDLKGSVVTALIENLFSCYVIFFFFLSGNWSSYVSVWGGEPFFWIGKSFSFFSFHKYIPSYREDRDVEWLACIWQKAEAPNISLGCRNLSHTGYLPQSRNTPCLDPQAVPVELPAAGRGPEDWPDDGGVCPALLSVQPRGVPVHRWARGAPPPRAGSACPAHC